MRIIIALLAFGVAGAANADPCTATIPKKGTPFSGTVRYVGDGDGLCVGKTSDPKEWIEVRVADFYSPELHAPGGKEAKAALAKVAMNRNASCVAGRKSWDRTIAMCTIGGKSVGDLMRAQGIKEGGNR